mmetsp:Transcript_8338/g.18685  ORF Transcript_8338/g.18685 Transcript_8338/m.18685 type:complete len:373 (+) Transcript_8338:80-1198(+)
MRENLLLELVSPYPELMVVFRRLQEQGQSADESPNPQASEAGSDSRSKEREETFTQKCLEHSLTSRLTADADHWRLSSSLCTLAAEKAVKSSLGSDELFVAKTERAVSSAAVTSPPKQADAAEDPIAYPPRGSFAPAMSTQAVRLPSVEDCTLLWDTARLRQQSPSLRAAEPYVDRHAETWFARSLRGRSEDTPYGWEAYREEHEFGSGGFAEDEGASSQWALYPRGIRRQPSGEALTSSSRVPLRGRTTTSASEADCSQTAQRPASASSRSGRLTWSISRAVHRSLYGQDEDNPQQHDQTREVGQGTRLHKRRTARSLSPFATLRRNRNRRDNEGFLMQRIWVEASCGELDGEAKREYHGAKGDLGLRIQH